MKSYNIQEGLTFQDSSHTVRIMNAGISESSRLKAAEVLNDLLATTYALYLKTQHAHWNIEGKEFFSLHLLFEKQYEEMAEAVDEIAERIRSLGFAAEGSFRAFEKRSWIQSDQPKSGYVSSLLEAHETLCREARPHIAQFQKWGDDISADLLIRRLTFHEKASWMLRSQA